MLAQAFPILVFFVFSTLAGFFAWQSLLEDEGASTPRFLIRMLVMITGAVSFSKLVMLAVVLPLSLI